MNLIEIRNKMWVVVAGRPERPANEIEVRRWATLQLIEKLQNQSLSGITARH